MKICDVQTIVIIFLLGCKTKETRFNQLEGKWTASGDQGDGHSWFMEYTFKGNSYHMTGYPPISESGKMQIKKVIGDSLLIQFDVIKSNPESQTHENWLILKENEMTINSMKFFKAVD